MPHLINSCLHLFFNTIFGEFNGILMNLLSHLFILDIWQFWSSVVVCYIDAVVESD